MASIEQVSPQIDLEMKSSSRERVSTIVKPRQSLIFLQGVKKMGINLVGANLYYNWYAWGWLVERLVEWGVDIREFRGHNYGGPISAETCAMVADAIEAHLSELGDEVREWLAPQIDEWRHCGGCVQW